MRKESKYLHEKRLCHTLLYLGVHHCHCTVIIIVKFSNHVIATFWWSSPSPRVLIAGDSLIGDIDQTFVSVLGKVLGQARAKQATFEGKSPLNKSHWVGKSVYFGHRRFSTSLPRNCEYNSITQGETFFKPQLACLRLGWSARNFTAFFETANCAIFTARFFGTAKPLAKYLADTLALQRKWKPGGSFVWLGQLTLWWFSSKG